MHRAKHARIYIHIHPVNTPALHLFYKSSKILKTHTNKKKINKYKSQELKILL